MPVAHKFHRAGLPTGHVFKGLDTPTDGVAAVYPGSAGNEIVHSATGTDYIVYNAGGDTIVYG